MANPGGFLKRIPAFSREVRAEANKIVWPTGRETLVTTILVVIMTTILGLFFFGIDSFFGWVVSWLLSLASPA